MEFFFFLKKKSLEDDTRQRNLGMGSICRWNSALLQARGAARPPSLSSREPQETLSLPRPRVTGRVCEGAVLKGRH